MRITGLFTGAIILAIILSSAFFLPSFSYAQAGPYPHVTPEKPKPAPSSPKITVMPRKSAASKKVAVPILKGIVFVSSVKDFKPRGVSRSILGRNGLYIEKSLPFLRSTAFIKNMESKLNKPLTFEGISEIISAVRSLYKSRNRPFVDAVVPPQDVSSGILQVVVMEYKVGAIKVSGNRWFSSGFIISQLNIRAGQTLSETGLASSINWINENPFLHAETILSPGRVPGNMDINILAKDLNPFRIYAGFDNQGIPSLGINEWGAGFNYGNMFGMGQMLSYEISQSLSTRYRANSMSYDIPFPWKGRIEINGSYSTASPVTDPDFRELGRNSQVSLYYKQELPYFINNGLTIKQTLGLGYDFKTTNNNLAFGGAQVFQATAQVDQFPVFYSMSEQDPFGVTNLNNRFVLSPGGFNPDNSDASFSSIYAGTRSKYEYDELNLSRLERLPSGFGFYSSANFQIASGNLLYTEQLAAGGLYTVPGYLTDTATGSRGIIIKEELNLPSLNIAPVLFYGTKVPYRNNSLPVTLSLFFTYADLSSVNNVSSSTGLPDTSVLESIGPELKMDVNGYLSLDFALGWRLRHLPLGSYGKGLFEDVVISLSV